MHSQGKDAEIYKNNLVLNSRSNKDLKKIQ